MGSSVDGLVLDGLVPRWVGPLMGWSVDGLIVDLSNVPKCFVQCVCWDMRMYSV